LTASFKLGHHDVRHLNLNAGPTRQSTSFEVTVKKTPIGEEYRGWTAPDGMIFHKEIGKYEF
jgi:hypothetical protein